MTSGISSAPTAAPAAARAAVDDEYDDSVRDDEVSFRRRRVWTTPEVENGRAVRVIQGGERKGGKGWEERIVNNRDPILTLWLQDSPT